MRTKLHEFSELWKIADRLRGSRSWDPLALIEAARERRLKVDTQSFAALLDRMGVHGGMIVPQTLVSFLTALAKRVNPKTVLDPFANFLGRPTKFATFVRSDSGACWQRGAQQYDIKFVQHSSQRTPL